METKQIVYEYIRKATLRYLQTHKPMAMAGEIADELHISRSLVSKHLNTLYEAGKLIKISGRPVWYLDKISIESEFGAPLQDDEFLSVGDFECYIQENKWKRVSLEHVIGFKASLGDVLLKLNTLIRYPSDTPIAIVLFGESGTGRRYLAQMLWEQARQEGQIASSAKLRAIDCNRPDVSYEDILSRKAASGMLLIRHAEHLPEPVQLRLVGWLREDRHQEEQIPYIVFSSQFPPEEVFCDSLCEITHLKLRLPPLAERSLKEREELVFYQLRKEARKIGRQIRISSQAYFTLSHFSYEGNVTGLIQAVTDTCSNAYSGCSSKEGDVMICQYHLPEQVWEFCEDSAGEDTNPMSFEDIRKLLQDERIIALCEGIKDNFYNHNEAFLRFCEHTMNQYCDYLVFENKMNNGRIEAIEKILKNIFNIIESKYKVVLNTNYTYMLSRLLYKCTYIDSELPLWEEENTGFIKKLLEFLASGYGNEYMIVRELERLIHSSLEVPLPAIGLLFLVLNIHLNNFTLWAFKVAGLIVAHGRSTASSISDAANRLLGQSVFEAIDMPLEIKTGEIISHIRNYVKLKGLTNDLILMVDMGSLEEIGQEISRNFNIRVGVINNVSTRMAISIGSHILENLGMDLILQKSCAEVVCSYKIVENENKRDAIIFATETGLNATDRLIQVFKSSLPKPVNIHFLASDCDDFSVFPNYHVLFITGALKTAPKGIPYIPLEDIVSSASGDYLDVCLKKHLEPEELRQLNANLLKNFSLENVMQSLTILNPNRLMDTIEGTLQQFQRELKMPFGSKVLFGLYIHISCLVERLVTKSPVITHGDLENFKTDHAGFIQCVSVSFKNLCSHYNIQIPISEIAYLYDYIYSGFHKK